MSKRFSTREDIMFGAVIDPERKQSLEICVLGKSEMVEHTNTGAKGGTATRRSIAETVNDPGMTSTTPGRIHQSRLKDKSKEATKAQDEFVFNQLEEQRGYFEKTDRNEWQGEDLDVPTYLRRGIKIRLNT